MSLHNDVIFIKQDFNDVDHLLEVAPDWNLKFRQLDSGLFKGELQHVSIGDLHLGLSKFNRKFDQEGLTPNRYRTIALLSSREQELIWRGKRVSGKNIMVFPESGEVDALSFPGFKVYTIAISNATINEYLITEGLNNQALFENPDGIITPNIQALNMIRSQLEYFYRVVNEHPESVNSRAFYHIFSKEIPAMVLNSIWGGRALFSSHSPDFRKRILQKALDYIRSCKEEMPSVLELCLIAGASQRTIEYAFKEKYGFGPKEYMKKQSLNHVHSALKLADPRKVTIKQLAGKFGFWHMGQFSADYKKLFCELPSETLKRNR